MAPVASQLIEEVTAHAQRTSLEDAREICAEVFIFRITYAFHNLNFTSYLKVCLFSADCLYE